jgi:Ca-activated chloride channel family protein
LVKAPAQARAPFGASAALGKNASSFAGPGVHGSLALSHTKVLSGQHQTVYAEVRLGADAAEPAKQRAPIAMAIVLDTSGSMSGEKIDEAKRAVLRLIGEMRDDDEIAVIRYSDFSSIVQPLARVGDVRASVEANVRNLTANGGTSIAPALGHGARALAGAQPGRVRRVVLVSDGLDSTRAQSEATARSSFQSGITVSSLGVGLDFDESYMGSVATSGHGNFAFVKDGAQIASFLHKELVETSTTTVEHAKVRVRIPSGMRFVRATGADARVDGDEVELAFGSLFAGDERRAVIEMAAQLDDGEARSFGATATWDRVGGASSRADARPLIVAATRDASEVTRDRDGAVLASATSVIASERQLQAAQGYNEGDVAKADALIVQNLIDLDRAAAAAPTAAADSLRRQAETYGEDKKSFARPSTEEGRTRAKAAAQKDLNNLGRMGF